jgi:hypothetical protein
MKKLSWIAVAVAISCGRPSSRYSTDTVAVVEGKPVSLVSFRAYFASNAGRPIAESSPAVASGLFDQFLREEIWRRTAGQSGPDDELLRREAPSLLLSRAGPLVSPSDAEINQEYDRHPERYHRAEEAQVGRIFTRLKPDAEKARSRVVKGEDFEKVAREVSQSPDAGRGGRLGLIARGDLPSEFESAIFRLRPGEVSPLIAAEGGFLLFKLIAKTPERDLTREEAQPEIRQRLSRDKADRYLSSLVERARQEHRVEVFAGKLPFVYTGEFLPGGKRS